MNTLFIWIAFLFMGTPELTDNNTLSAYPNPCDSQVMISFILTEDTKVSLDIYNIEGKHLISFLNGELHESGYWGVRWYLNAEDGHRVPSGVYIYILTEEHKVTTKKLTVLN